MFQPFPLLNPHNFYLKCFFSLLGVTLTSDNVTKVILFFKSKKKTKIFFWKFRKMVKKNQTVRDQF
ncbi:hypothetical protein EGI26_04190 [Lacihabitans sp. CCS-44]|nr:hypothetical protein [Lacihabitans sp. CCS-44]